MAASLKTTAATVAAFAALACGVEVASAGILDPVVETPPVPVVENPPPLVDEAVSEVDEAVADAKETADEAVAEATETAVPVIETAGPVVEQVTKAAENVTAVVEEVVDGTPGDGLLGDVERIVDPILKDIERVPGAVTRPGGHSATPSSAMPTAGTSGAQSGGAMQTLSPETQALAQLNASSGAGLRPDLPLAAVSISRQFGEATARGAGAAGQPPQFSSLEFASQEALAPASVSRADNDSSNAPWPFAPLFPAGTAATAAAVAGAAGAAFVAALLAALTLLAPRAGRWLRPEPSLGWPPPAVPSLERPG